MSNCCGIVTYNRYELLKNCLEAVFDQTLPPKLLIIFDNASTDGTTEMLCEEYGLVERDRSKRSILFNGSTHGIEILLYSNRFNGGGSLGFHTITKYFYENTVCENLWLMDDDGTPHEEALAKLSAVGEDYCGALVKNEANHNERAFRMRSTNSNSVNPFNSILISRNLVGVVGYPRSDFFIYGDEVEFDLRIKSFGFKSLLVSDAIHFHPADRQVNGRIKMLGDYKVISGSLRQYCYYRNTSYNLHKYYGKFKVIKWWLKIFAILIYRWQINELGVFLIAVYELRNEKFSRHLNYIK